MPRTPQQEIRMTSATINTQQQKILMIFVTLIITQPQGMPTVILLNQYISSTTTTNITQVAQQKIHTQDSVTIQQLLHLNIHLTLSINYHIIITMYLQPHQQPPPRKSYPFTFPQHHKIHRLLST